MARKKINDNTKMLVAKRIDIAMEAKQMSAVELSRLTGVSESDISNYRHARYLPRQDKVFLLALALGVSPAWLWGLADEMHPSNEVDYVFSMLNEEQREQVLDYARYLILKGNPNEKTGGWKI